MLRYLTDQYRWEEKIPDDTSICWIDLLNPTREEELVTERFLGIDIPTQEELHEIEPSSRLYEKKSSLFMTVNVPVEEGISQLRLIPVTFVLTHNHLVTLRYEETPILESFIYKLAHSKPLLEPLSLFLRLLNALVDAVADLLEQSIAEIERISRHIFTGKREASPIFSGNTIRNLLMRIGSNGEQVSSLRDSLISFIRLSSFLDKEREGMTTITMIQRDLLALSDQASFIANKSTFLLNATLGLVNLQQNDIIKIFSVVAVILLPPTLLASLWGMNFYYMPELSAPFGYPLALMLIIFSGLLPYLYCKKRGWL